MHHPIAALYRRIPTVLDPLADLGPISQVQKEIAVTSIYLRRNQQGWIDLLTRSHVFQGLPTRIDFFSEDKLHEAFYPSFIMIADRCMPAINHIEFDADLISNTSRNSSWIEDGVQ